MPPTFIGKPIPTPQVNTGTTRKVPVKRPRRSGVMFVAGALGIVCLAGFSMAYYPASRPIASYQAASAVPTAPPVGITDSNNVSYPESVTILATNAAPAAPAAIVDTRAACTASVNGLRASQNVFPLIPQSALNNPTGCNPTGWNLPVVWYFLYKAIYILNWFAGVLAVLLTVYAGILYISGFANESHVKQAKTLLIACYVGLAIVFGARIILLEFAGTFSDGSVNSGSLGNIYNTTP